MNHHISIALAVLLFSGCTGIAEFENTRQHAPDIVGSIFQAQDFHAKTSLHMESGMGTVLWNPGDMISVFYGELNVPYASTNTKDTTVTTFTTQTLVCGTELINPDLWGLYPYDASATCDGTKVTTSVRSEQAGLPGTFDREHCVMLAKAYNFALTFYPACSGFKFSFSRDDISRIAIRGNEDEDLGGGIELTVGEYTGVPECTVTSGIKEVSLVPRQGQFFEPNEFYYVITVPTVLPKGFTVTFETPEGKLAYVYAKKPVVLERAMFSRLADIDTYATPIETEGGPDDELVTEDERKELKAIAENVFSLAKSQLKLLAQNVQNAENNLKRKKPKTDYQIPVDIRDGKLYTESVSNWTSGFFPGSLWLTYEYTGDEDILSLAKKYTGHQFNVLNYDTDHDIGFMINCSIGNAYRITGDSKYLPYVKSGADRLAARFNPTVGLTRSWDFGDFKTQYAVIIDNMMNLELLLDASRLCAGTDYVDIAKTHANTTMRDFFRSDYTTWQLVTYDETTGSVIRKQKWAGVSDDSCWARGEAWALYGYTMMFRETGDQKYLEQACHIADKVLSVLPENGIPYWDFSASDYQDSSAAAIIASALAELCGYSHEKAYMSAAIKMVRTLASDRYLSAAGQNSGFLVLHSVSDKNSGKVDTPLSYTDYYFLEAMARLTKIVE